MFTFGMQVLKLKGLSRYFHVSLKGSEPLPNLENPLFFSLRASGWSGERPRQTTLFLYFLSPSHLFSLAQALYSTAKAPSAISARSRRFEPPLPPFLVVVSALNLSLLPQQFPMVFSALQWSSRELRRGRPWHLRRPPS